MTDKKPCPICKGTGFSNGKICICISRNIHQGKEDTDFIKSFLGPFDKKGEK